jgi:hypothetical protein
VGRFSSDEEVTFRAPATYDNVSFVWDDAESVELGSATRPVTRLVPRRLPAIPVQKESGNVKDDRRSLCTATGATQHRIRRTLNTDSSSSSEGGVSSSVSDAGDPDSQRLDNERRVRSQGREGRSAESDNCRLREELRSEVRTIDSAAVTSDRRLGESYMKNDGEQRDNVVVQG